jgi:C-terminal processing protease CtpA/Prc
MLVALSVIAACSGENPVTPRSEPQVSAQVAREQNYSFSISPADRTVLVRFTRVRSDGVESVNAFMRRMFASADSAGATKLVLDLRSTRGGDAFLVVPLVKGILARERFAQRGGLVVIVGPESFSPGQNVASMLQRYANPVFVGEPII